MAVRSMTFRRVLASGTLGFGMSLALLGACSSASDYDGGGRRLIPPGGAVDGEITVLPGDSSAPPQSFPDTSPPRDTSVPDTNPFQPDAGRG
jgi:hypothetical protein